MFYEQFGVYTRCSCLRFISHYISRLVVKQLFLFYTLVLFSPVYVPLRLRSPGSAMANEKYPDQDHLTPLKAVKGYDSYTVIFVGEISPIIITEKGDYDYVKLIGLIAGIYRMVSMISPIYIVCGTRPLV
jgi:hypothetical protein